MQITRPNGDHAVEAQGAGVDLGEQPHRDRHLERAGHRERFASIEHHLASRLEVHDSDTDLATCDRGEPRHLGFQTREPGVGRGRGRRRGTLCLRSDGRGRRYDDEKPGRDERGGADQTVAGSHVNTLGWAWP
jgi:hypothetical protein